MKRTDRSRPLMMEVLLSVLFFLLCGTILFRTFGAAYEKSMHSGEESAALDRCRSVIDILFAAEDKKAAAASLGFDVGGVLTEKNAVYTLALVPETYAGGILYSGTLSAAVNGKDCFELPVALFEEVHP